MPKDGDEKPPDSSKSFRPTAADHEVGSAHHLEMVPEFGIWNPNIKDAAEMIALDLWFDGQIRGIDEPDDFDGDARAPWLLAALADTIEELEMHLSSDIESGRLKASFTRRNLDGRLVLDLCHVRYGDLTDWMGEMGLHPGDHMAEWEELEMELAANTATEVAFKREVLRSGDEKLIRALLRGILSPFAPGGDSEVPSLLRGMSPAVPDGDTDVPYLRAHLKASILECRTLKQQLQPSELKSKSKVERPLHTRSRRTLLTIIAALCDSAGIEHQQRGAAQRIKGLTELAGTPVDDGTIKSILDEIPDALETRMK